MKSLSLLALVLSVLLTARALSQSPADLPSLVDEAIRNNPEIRAALEQMAAKDARIPQSGALADPELIYMREGMPDFRYGEAMYSRLELMQMIMFPTKLSAMKAVAELEAEHGHHDHLEKVNEIIARLKMAYAELWLARQSQGLASENAALMRRMNELARIRYGAGAAEQQDVLKSSIEQSRMENELVGLRQRELSASAMLMGILNRSSRDTIGAVHLDEFPAVLPDLEAILAGAALARPMLIHESLNVAQSEVMVSAAKLAYLPDFKIALQYVTEPMGTFRGWTVTAGITIPFAPWTLGKAAGRVEEAQAQQRVMEAGWSNARAMVASSIRDSYFRAESARRQEERYRVFMIPQAKQSLAASMTAYENSRTDFFMLLDAYRTLVDLRMNALMLRMQYEQAIADLERASGITDFSRL